MKRKTIKATIAKKVNEWLDSIEDEQLRDLARNNTIVTGGCIASMFLKEKVHDFDLYFRTKDTAKRIAEYYVTRLRRALQAKYEADHTIVPSHISNMRVVEEDSRIKVMIKSAGIASETDEDDYQYFEMLDDAQDMESGKYVERAMGDKKEDVEDKNYRPVFASSNAITLSNKMQLIIRFYGEPEEIHKSYDFVHCTNYWTSWEGELVTRTDALECLLAREMRYIGSLYPVCSIIRTRKFLKRGFSITAGQYLKMIMQVNQLDLTDMRVLEDQLIGVDVAYFVELLDKLQDKDKERVDTTYLMEIIDRMF